jgi:hypothetical protein
MIRVSGFIALAVLCVALPAFAQAPSPPPRGPTPPAGAADAPTSPQPNCRAPDAGVLTLRREAVIAANTLQLRFVGRDASYPEPAVYCVQTNAELRNADGSPRDNTTFCIWEGFVQRARICGVAFSVQITRAGDEQLTLSVRR